MYSSYRHSSSGNWSSCCSNYRHISSLRGFYILWVEVRNYRRRGSSYFYSAYRSRSRYGYSSWKTTIRAPQNLLGYYSRFYLSNSYLSLSSHYIGNFLSSRTSTQVNLVSFYHLSGRSEYILR